MDPNAALRQIHEFLAAHHTGDEVDKWCCDLFDWLRKGGFAPTWEKYPLGTSYVKTRAVSDGKDVTYLIPSL